MVAVEGRYTCRCNAGWTNSPAWDDVNLITGDNASGGKCYCNSPRRTFKFSGDKKSLVWEDGDGKSTSLTAGDGKRWQLPMLDDGSYPADSVFAHRDYTSCNACRIDGSGVAWFGKRPNDAANSGDSVQWST